jgi:hypothetical protein
MKYMKPCCCPVCGSEESVSMFVSDSSGRTGLGITNYGLVSPRVCRKCGIVYISQTALDGLNVSIRRIENEKRHI